MGTGNPTGAPPKYSDPAELQKKIESYFEDADHPTITGLCLHCGFESRQSFYDYELRPGFSYTIKRARLMIENKYERALMSDKVTGPIFALKNLGWSDKQDLNHTSDDGSMSPSRIELVAPDDNGKD